MNFYIVDDICLSPLDVMRYGEDSAIRSNLEGLYSCRAGKVLILRRSIDARKKSAVVWRFRVAAQLPDSSAAGLQPYVAESAVPVARIVRSKRIIVIGSGPAGLFATLRLLDHGFDVTLIERGSTVDIRDRDVEILKTKGILDPESNVLFGEGGAGTYSDGKLTTRTNRPEQRWFFDTLVRFGAKSEILYDAKPHVGTDSLSKVVASVRAEIVSRGAEVVFGEKADRLIIEMGSVVGVVCASGKEFRGSAVVLATGHSARDTYAMLDASGVALEKKGFAVGMRIEHPAEFINTAQFGKFSPHLPSADYRLVHNDPQTGRGVYSFCMCPGGEVVNSASEQGALCVNWMSFSDRGLQWSNAAIVVSVKAEDIRGSVLAGIEFQREAERRCYDLGGGSFSAPVQSAAAFIAGKKASSGNRTKSYRPGTVDADLSSMYPSWISEPLKRGLRRFDSMIRGFSQEGLLIGAETRTSSPVRINRGESMESTSHPGLYPVGEGAGYAGGIVSSAVDGIRCADVISERFSG